MRLSPNLILAVCSAAAVLLLAEGALRVAFPPDHFLDAHTDEFWQLRQTGQPLPEGADVEEDAELGWRMRRNYRAEGVRHNSQGNRGGAEVAAHAEGLRIVSIGDSFTYGLRLRDDETFSAILANELDAEVINLGVNGFGIDQAVLRWERDGLPLGPDVVLLGYFIHDFHRNAFTVGVRPKPRFVVAEDGGLELEPPHENAPYVEQFWQSRIVDLLRKGRQRIQDRLGVLPTEMLESRQAVSEQLLARLKASVEASGAELVVIVIPHEAHPKSGLYGDWIAARTLESCASLELTCVDMTGEIEGLYALGHWNAAGNRRAAERIAAVLP